MQHQSLYIIVSYTKTVLILQSFSISIKSASMPVAWYLDVPRGSAIHVSHNQINSVLRRRIEINTGNLSCDVDSEPK